MTRLRVLYVVAGHDLVPTAGPTRNALSLARAWAGDADVTLAFRRVGSGPGDAGLRVLEIDPAAPAPDGPDDAAIRGMSVGQLLAYLRRVRTFLDEHLDGFDVVLEKSWLLSGLLCRRARRRGVPGAVIENVVRVFRGSGLAGRVKHGLIRARVARYLRETPVIAETPELKNALVDVLGLRSDAVDVVTLGVDHELFAPADRTAARRELGIADEGLVALYFGAFDDTHDLAPALRARGRCPDSPVRVHLLGDGTRRGEYEELAAAAAPGAVTFHGRVPHERVPRFVAASDLCLAPYDTTAFPGGEVAYSTLKIPEAMACARPVASVPSGNVRRLIQHGRSGLLLPNRTESWAELFTAPPSGDELAALGAAARAAVSELTWEHTARGYHALCDELLRSTP